MTSTTQPPIDHAAKLALQTAREHCSTAGVDPQKHQNELTKLVTEAVQTAMVELTQDKNKGGPIAAHILTLPFYQNIYFADAGRAAANCLILKILFPDNQHTQQLANHPDPH